jgi:DNA polymerase
VEFEEWSALHAEFTQLVSEMQYHLRWQEQQGWAGIPREEEEYVLEAPDGDEHLPSVEDTTSNKLDLNSITSFLQPQPTAAPKPVAEPKPSPPSPEVLKDLKRNERPFVILRSVPEQEQRRRREGLRAVEGELENRLQELPSKRRRNRYLFGEGSVSTRLMFVGESPGGKESITGDFQADAEGRLWLEMLRSLRLKPEDVYRTHVLKIRPDTMGSPSADELEMQAPYLWQEIQWVQPEIIVTLGLTATQIVLNTHEKFLSKLRERWHQREGMHILPTFHPLYLLRNPTEKQRAWNDLKLILERLRDPQGGTNHATP